MWFCARVHVVLVIIVVIAKDVVAQTSCTTINPSPPHAICNQRGYWRHLEYEINAKQTVPNIETCKHWFLDEQRGPVRSPGVGFHVFSFNTSSNLCTLYPRPDYPPSTRQFHADASSDTVFYAQNCFNCHFHCPQPPNINLVKNPGFELSTDHIGPWVPLSEGTPFHVGSPGHNSRNAAFANVSLSVHTLAQTLTLCKNRSYMYGFDLRAIRTNIKRKSANPIDQLKFNLGELLVKRQFGDNNRWQRIEGSFVADAHRTSPDVIEKLLFFDSVNRRYKVYIDNVAVHPLPAAPATTGSNLIRNGGFESGALAPWTYTGFRQGYKKPYMVKNAIISPGLSGKYALRSNFQSSVHGEPNSVLSQKFSAKPYTSYVLSFDYNVLRDMTLSIYVGGAGNNTQWDMHPITNKTTRFERVFQSERGTQLMLSLQGDTSYYAGTKKFDSLVLDSFQVREAVK